LIRISLGQQNTVISVIFYNVDNDSKDFASSVDTVWPGKGPSRSIKISEEPTRF